MPTSLEETKRQVARNRRKGKRVAKKNSSLGTELYKLVCLVLGVVMLVAFFPSKEAEITPQATAVQIDVDKSQGRMVQNYIAYAHSIDANGGHGNKPNSPDLSNAYVQASAVVPEYDQVAVQSDGQQLYAIGSPTHAYDPDAAFVTNTSVLLNAEYADIKWAELDLGLTEEEDYQEISEYVKTFSQVQRCITGVYEQPGYSSNSKVTAGWGPAVTIKNFITRVQRDFTNGGSAHTAYNGGNSLSTSYVDAMLVESAEDYDKYMAGEDVTVTYVCMSGTGAGGKGHCFPWGLGQTYIQRYDYFDSLVLNWNDPGSFTPIGSASYPAVSTVWNDGILDTATTFRDVLVSAKDRTGAYYWAPSIEADLSTYLGKGGANTNFYRAYGSTSCIFECHPGTMFDTLFGSNGKFKDYYLVGVLVYATEDAIQPDGCAAEPVLWSEYNAAKEVTKDEP